MAVAKKGKQDGLAKVTDEIVGEISTTFYDINLITEVVYQYYIKLFSHHEWVDKDFAECKSWVWKALMYNDGQFDPRKLDIVSPELQFDITLEEPWAKYKYGDEEGSLALKGTIDLVTKLDDTIYEIVDWKTGRRWDWAKDQEKTAAKLQKDKQLRFYHYALHKIYPHLSQVMVTIFFINDGGPFTVYFTKEQLAETEEMLKETFLTIKNDNNPNLNRSWKCRKFCNLGTTTFEGTHIKPQTEFRWNQVARKGETMTRCDQISYELKRKGLEKVIEEMSEKGHSVDDYHQPGGGTR